MTIDPQDSRLRRLHRIDPSILDEKKSEMQGAGVEPVSIIEYRHPTGSRVLIVCDGTHRVQAALELDLPEIEYQTGNERDVRRVARERGYNFDDLAMRAKRFEHGNYE